VKLTFVPVDDAVLAESRTANEQMTAAMASVRMEEVPPAKVRAARAAGTGAFPKPVPDPRATELRIAGPAGEIPLRVIRAERPVGAFLHIHGGGFTYGAPDEYDDLLRVIVDRMRLTAVSVDYRLAPEHPFPAGPDDCEIAALWFVEHAGELAAAPGSVETSPTMLIGGESAGANLVVTTMLRLRDRHGLQPFAGAMLCYGWYDLGLTPSMRNWGPTSLVLSTPLADWLATGYVADPDREARRSPEVSPLHADLRGLAPALISVGTADPLVDDSTFLAARWHQAGNPTELDVYPEAMHGFDSVPIALAEVAMGRYVAWAERIVTAAAPR
jgi:acetyl esterase/lipase